MNFQHIQMNFAPGKHTRCESFDGRDYLVAPVVMLTVGVHKGSNGPVLYEESDLAKTPEAWNMKPLVVYHPMQNGVGISACSADVVEKQGVGLIMNARYDGKLRAEAWFDIEKTRRVDERVVEALEENRMMEVSTGLFSDNEQTEGIFNNAATGQDEEYKAIARNYRPDHLAILPDQIGACSIADGAGLLQTNALSHSDTFSSLYRAVNDRFGPEVWVTDVFDDWFVFSNGGKLFRLDYTKESDVVKISDGLAEAVIAQTVYRTVDGTLIGNSATAPVFEPPTDSESDMPKSTQNDQKKLVDGLIANEKSPYQESHREFLMNQTEEFLKELEPKVAEAPPKEDPKETQQQETVTPPTQTQNAAQTQQPPKPATVEEYIANAPPGMQDMLRRGVQSHEAEKQRLIDTITANEANIFTPEALKAMPYDQLTGLARIAAVSQKQESNQQQAPLYNGAAGAAPMQNASFDEDPLDLPQMTF